MMGKSKRGIWPILLFMGMAVGLNAVSGQTKYFQLKGKLELTPGSPPESRSSITWKLQSNKVIEYEPLFSETSDVYGRFKNRATLDTATGRLEITDLTKEDSGVYTVEVKAKVTGTYTVDVIRSISAIPKIPNNPKCDIHPVDCILTCEVPDTTDAEPVTYSWKEGTGPWQRSNKYLKINVTGVGKKFFCKIENPISEKDSVPYPIPQDNTLTWTVVGIISLVVIIGFPAILSQFIPRLKTEREKLFKNCTKTDPENAAPSSEDRPATGEPLIDIKKTEGGMERNGNSN
ncbi:CD48 antigen-like isoform X2 [Osmerus eperlanus]|uniref:CD48 antigen-like isoform X2 n=1 Tax=Osmerus eperlanus TaxID=29151 RepID=UPI002E0E0C1B